MTRMSKLMNTGPKKPEHYDLLIEVWMAAQAEPIGILIKVPEQDFVYWRRQLYLTRVYSNDQGLFGMEINTSHFPEEANLQIVHEQYGTRKRPNHVGDIDLSGVLNLDLPDA